MVTKVSDAVKKTTDLLMYNNTCSLSTRIIVVLSIKQLEERVGMVGSGSIIQIIRATIITLGS